MKNIKILLFILIVNIAYAQKLTIIEQDFEKAREVAKNENKLLFIDFYTTWCAPCKKIDKWIFQNDSITKRISNDFVLLRYDAEQDRKFNLSKKHHVNSYPTGIILNSDGYVLTRKYGFPGDDVTELSSSIFEFTNKALELNKTKSISKGYSNDINVSKYPKFYIDFVNRDDKKVVSRKDFKDYWLKKHNVLSEEYFSTVVYFAKDLPSNIGNKFLENKNEYIKLYGYEDVDVALIFITFGKFDTAIQNKNQMEFDKAVEFMKKALSKESINQMLPMFKTDFEKAKNG